MTNYMGVNRLKRIIHNYLINVKGIDERKIKKDSLFFERYRKGRGCEWLNCGCGVYTIKLFVDGSKAKAVTIEEYRFNESTEEDVYFDRIITYYDDNFNPFPNATWFSSNVAGIKARKEGGRFFFKGDNEAEANKYVCFDIAKNQQNIDNTPNRLALQA